MENETRKYSNGDITVVWKPSICIHSTICFKGLPPVFNPRKRPWVTIEGADSDRIIAQVQQCPSGALSFFYNNEQEEKSQTIEAETKLEALPNGPLLVYGNVLIKDAHGHEFRKNKVTAFCRCGQSKNKPFCDGSHIKAGFVD